LGLPSGDAIFDGTQDGIFSHTSVLDNVLLGTGVNDYKTAKQAV
jgi:hypothetical protein